MTKTAEQLTLKPIRGVAGEIHLPGSKSMSNRALLLASLASGPTQIHNLLASDDIRHMLNALGTLQVKTIIEPDNPTTVTVCGNDGPFKANGGKLFLGNAGTAMRPLCAALCLGHGEFELTGEPRMYERTIGPLVEGLQHIGAQIEYLGTEGFPPLKITANGLQGGSFKIPGNVSSQFITALLMAAPFAKNPVEIQVEGEQVSKPYLKITMDMMAQFGVTVTHQDYQHFTTKPSRYVSPGKFHVEGDASSASYFLSAAAIKGGTVRVTGVGKNSPQGDIAHAKVLERMGAKVTWGDTWIEVSRGILQGLDLDLVHMPDAAMTVASTALFAKGKTAIRNVHNWRIKETDRLHAMATELRKVGAQVEEGRDYLVIDPPETIQPATIDTYNDHRMAMAMSLAALGDAEIVINDPQCTSKTFPDYFEKFASICH